MAMNKASLYFWKYIQKELEFHGLPVGIAALGYSQFSHLIIILGRPLISI